MDMMSYLMGRNSGGGGKGAKIEVVTELPETGEANVIYLVPKETEDENNIFDEYLYINNEWELIGSTAIDISGKQDTMQFSTMPNASVDYSGKIVQYTGTTNANYTNGYFYICISETENDVTTYSWSNVEVQNNDDIFVFVDEDTTGRSVSSLNSIPENKEKLKRLGQVILDGKVPAVFFKRKGYHSSGGTYPIHPTLYYWNVDNDKIYFTFEIIYPNRSGSYIYYYEVQYGTTQDTQYLATSYPNGTNSSFGSKSTTNSLVPKNVGTEIYRYPISSQYFNWTLDLERYSSSKTYQIGDYIVSYNSNTTMPSQMCILYKCNTADTTGNWDSSKWTQTTYMEYLSDKLVGGALNGSY